MHHFGGSEGLKLLAFMQAVKQPCKIAHRAKKWCKITRLLTKDINMAITSAKSCQIGRFSSTLWPLKVQCRYLFTTSKS